MKKMNKIGWKGGMLSLFLSIGGGLQAAVLPAVPDSVYLFAYNPDNTGGRSGLQFAWSGNRAVWTSVGGGHQFVKSDFGA